MAEEAHEPESFHVQVKKLVTPKNKEDAYVYRAGSTGLTRDPSKQHEGVWNAEPNGLAQIPLRKSPVLLWVFFYDHLKNTDILDGILDNNPNQGKFGYICQDPSEAKPEEMVFFLPDHQLPSDYKPGGIWVQPVHKLENLKELEDGATGFMVIGDRVEKAHYLDVAGTWKLLGRNDMVKLTKNVPVLRGRQKKEPFGVKIREKSTGVFFPVKLPSSITEVHILKDKIYTKRGIPSEDQRLSFDGEPLEDNEILHDYGVRNGDIIDLEPMKVYVNTTSGMRFSFAVSPDEPVEELMEKLAKKEGTPVERQVLTFYEKKLKPSKTLNFYHIKHMNVIDMERGPPVKKMRVFAWVPEGPEVPNHGDRPRTVFDGPPSTATSTDPPFEHNPDDPTLTYGRNPNTTPEGLGGDPPRKKIGFDVGLPSKSTPIAPPGEDNADDPTLTYARNPNKTPEGPGSDPPRIGLDVGPPSGSTPIAPPSEDNPDDPSLTYARNPNKTPDGPGGDPPMKKIELNVLPTATFGRIKKLVEEQTGVPKAKQRIFFQDREMDDEKPIAKVQLRDGDTIRMDAVPEPEVEVKLPDGTSRQFFFDPEESVKDFTKRLPQVFSPGTGPKLTFNDRELEDEDPMGKYNLKKGDVLLAEPDDRLQVDTPYGIVKLSPLPVWTPNKIKDVMEEKLGVPKAHQRVFFLDEELVDDDKPIDKDKLQSMGPKVLKMEPVNTELKIKMPNGKTRTFIMDPDQTVGDFTKDPKHKYHFPPGTKLSFNDVELVDEEPLGKYNLKKGDMLTAESDGIAIYTPLGKVMLTRNLPTLTPSDIKEVVEEKTDIPKSQQRLFYLERELLDDKRPVGIPGLKALRKHGLLLKPVPVEVKIKMPNGKTRTFVMDPAQTVGDFTRFHKYHFPPGTKLRLNNVELVDGEPVGKYNLKKGDVLTAEPDGVAIETPSGRVVLTQYSPTMKLSDIEDFIEEKTGVPKSQQRLFYFDQELVDDEKPLGKAKLKALRNHGLFMKPIPVEVKIKMPNGKTRMFFMDPAQTVGDFTKRHNAHFPPGTKLMFDDVELVDEEPLGKYNLKKGVVWTSDPNAIPIETPRGKVMLNLNLPTLAPLDIEDVIEEETGEPKSRQFQLDEELVDDKIQMGLPGGKVMLNLHSPTLTPSDIKDVIEEQTGLPKSRQRLFYLDEELVEDEKPLDKSKLQNMGMGAIRMEPVDEDDPEDPALAKSRKARAFYLSEPEEMDISLPNGKKVTLSISPTMTVQELKKVVEEKVPDMKEQKMRLFFFDLNGNIDDNTPVSKVMFDRGSPLEVKQFEITIEQEKKGQPSFQLYPDPHEYLDDIKDRIEKQGFPVGSQCITFMGSKLDNIRTLAAQGIKHKSKLKLEQMRIFVRMPDGRKKLRLRVDLKSTIKVIKKKIAKKTGQHYQKQSILLGGEDLDDKATLGDYNIEHGDELTMEKFRIDVMDGSDGTTVTLTDVARSDSINVIREQILKEFGRRVDPGQLYWQRRVAALDDSSSLNELGIPHKSILIIRIPEEKAAEYKADRLRFNKFLATKKFSDVDDDIIMPVEPDLRTRTFIFDNDATPIDGLITVSVLHWSGKIYKFDDLRPRDSIKALRKRIMKKKKKKFPKFHLRIHSTILEESGRLLDLGVGHRSIVVMERKNKKSIAIVPELDRVSLGPLKSHTTDKITVQIKMWNGQSLELEIGPTEYVDDIRDELFNRLSVPQEYQILSFGGDLVDDILSLDKQNITDGSLLVLEHLKIQVNLPFTTTLKFKLEPQDTVAFIKRRIAKLTAYAAKVQCLLFQGEVLTDSNTMIDCNIQHEDEVQLELFVVDILDLKGAQFEVSGSIHPGSTLSDVQRIIAKKQLIPVHLQQLRLHEKLLDPSLQLSEQGVGHKSLLVLEVLSKANAQQDEKREKVRLEVPRPLLLRRQSSNPELESPSLGGGKKVPTDVRKEKIKSVDMDDPFADRVSKPETVGTKPVMRVRMEEKKKHHAMNVPSVSSVSKPLSRDERKATLNKSFDLATGAGGRVRTSGRKKAKSVDALDDIPSKRGQKTDKRRRKRPGNSPPRPHLGNSRPRPHSGNSRPRPHSGNSRPHVRAGFEDDARPSAGSATAGGAKTKDELSQMTIRELKNLNLSLGGDVNQAFLEKSDLVDHVYELGQKEQSDRLGALVPIGLSSVSKPLQRDDRRARMPNRPLDMAAATGGRVRTSAKKRAKSVDSGFSNEISSRRGPKMDKRRGRKRTGNSLPRVRGVEDGAKPDVASAGRGIKTKDELSQMTIQQLKKLNLSLGGDPNLTFVEKSELVNHVYALYQKEQSDKPFARGKKKKSKAVRSKSMEPVDSQRDHSEQTGESTKKKRSSSVDTGALGKLAARMKVEKKDRKAKGKKGGGWMKMF